MEYIIILIKIVAVLGLVLSTVPFMILAERKISAWLQDRLGPNRAGPLGLLQPLADGLKLFFKEDYNPPGVDKILFFLAPSVAMFMALVAFAVIPFCGNVEIAGEVYSFQIAQVNIGILYVLGAGSLAVYGVVIGGWASNNKYSFLGGLRAAAQMISYEVPMTLMILTMIVITGTLSLETIVDQQISSGVWNVFTQPLTFVVFLICMFAETNRAPFDLAECEQELVAGFHTEYSSMKFAMFFLGEYAHIIVASSLCIVMFFGGWDFPGLFDSGTETITLPKALLGVAIFYVKIWMFIFFFMWVRWTLPRFRYDQLMRLCWYGLVPLGLGLLMLNAVIAYYPTDTTQSRWWQLGANVAMIVVVMLVTVVSQVKMAKDNTQLVEYAQN